MLDGPQRGKGEKLVKVTIFWQKIVLDGTLWLNKPKEIIINTIENCEMQGYPIWGELGRPHLYVLRFVHVSVCPCVRLSWNNVSQKESKNCPSPVRYIIYI